MSKSIVSCVDSYWQVSYTNQRRTFLYNWRIIKYKPRDPMSLKHIDAHLWQFLQKAVTKSRFLCNCEGNNFVFAFVVRNQHKRDFRCRPAQSHVAVVIHLGNAILLSSTEYDKIGIAFSSKDIYHIYLLSGCDDADREKWRMTLICPQ
jgi:hypothetical protein